MKLTEKTQGVYAEYKAASNKAKAELIAAIKQAITGHFRGCYSWDTIDKTYNYSEGIELNVLGSREYVEEIYDIGSMGYTDKGNRFGLEDLTCEDLYHILEVFDEIIEAIAETT